MGNLPRFRLEPEGQILTRSGAKLSARGAPALTVYVAIGGI